MTFSPLNCAISQLLASSEWLHLACLEAFSAASSNRMGNPTETRWSRAEGTGNVPLWRHVSCDCEYLQDFQPSRTLAESGTDARVGDRQGRKTQFWLWRSRFCVGDRGATRNSVRLGQEVDDVLPSARSTYESVTFFAEGSFPRLARENLPQISTTNRMVATVPEKGPR